MSLSSSPATLEHVLPSVLHPVWLVHAAHAAGRVVLCVAPGSMRGNWVVRSYSERVFDDIEQLAEYLVKAAQ